jgi:hypothetical protein
MTRWPFMRGGERGESTGWSEGERRFHRATVVVYDISPRSPRVTQIKESSRGYYNFYNIIL